MTLEPATTSSRFLGWAPCPTCGARIRITATGLFFRHPSLALDWPGGRLDHSRDCGASAKPWDQVWDTSGGAS